MATEATFWGGAVYVSTGSAVLLRTGARCYVIGATASLNATLPDARAFSAVPGSWPICVINDSVPASGYDVTIKDSNGDTVVVVGGKEAAKLSLSSTDAAYGYWSATIYDTSA